MAIVDYVQRTPEWFAWRKTGITASMVPIILGASPYSTPYQLWAELVGLKEPDDLSKNWHVQRGVHQEPEARTAVEKKLGRPFLPVCVEADHNPLFKASLDGLFELETEKEVLEIKCPCEKIYNDILANQGKSANFQMYAIQVQWQLNASDAQKGRLCFYLRGRNTIHIPIKRNQGFINKAEAKVLEFWELIQTKTPPALIEGRDNVLYELPEVIDENMINEASNEERENFETWIENVETFKSLSSKVKVLDEQKKELKSQMKNIEEFFGNKIPENVQTFDKDGIRATRVERAGKVDLDLFIEAISKKTGISKEELELMQLDHRKEGASYYRFTITEDNPTNEPAIVQKEQPARLPEKELVEEMHKAFSKPEPVVELKEEVPEELAMPRSASSFFNASTKSVFF